MELEPSSAAGQMRGSSAPQPFVQAHRPRGPSLPWRSGSLPHFLPEEVLEMPRITIGSGVNKTAVDVDMNAITNRNKSNVKATRDGGTVQYVAIRSLVLIGGGHDANLVTAMRANGCSAGNITVDKGSMLDKGELKVTGCSANRSEFDSAIKLFSKKKVLYT